MITQSTFKFPHSGHRSIPLDARMQSFPEIMPAHCYFLGFRICSEGACRYHHAWLVADSHDAFLNGLSREIESLRAQSGHSSMTEVELVFVQNLAIFDQGLQQADNEAGIQQIMPGTQRDDWDFSVLGWFAQRSHMGLMDFSAGDALSAIRQARLRCARLMREFPLIMGVRQAHPVTREFDALFSSEAGVILELVTRQPLPQLH